MRSSRHARGAARRDDAIHQASLTIASELAADIAESGIVLTGGGRFDDLDKRISSETGLPVFIVTTR